MVFYLDEDQQGRIWIGTMAQNIYYHQNDSIYPYPYNHIIQQYKGRFVQQGGEFYITPEDTLYTPLLGLGILKIQAKGVSYLYQSKTLNGLMAMEFGEKILSTLTNNADAQIKNYQQNYLEKGIYPSVEFYRDTSFSIIHGFSHDAGRTLSPIKKIGHDLYLMGRYNAYYLIQDNKIVWQGEFDNDWPGINKTTLQDEKGAIFLGLPTEQGGLRKYRDLDDFKKMKYDHYLEGQLISCVHQDRKEGIWASTLENGVYYSPGFDTEVYDKSSGLPIDNVIELALKDERTVFVGLRNGEVFQVDSDVNQIQKIQEFDKLDTYIFDMVYDRRRGILITAYARALEFMHNGQLIKIPRVAPDGSKFFFSADRITIQKNSPFLWGTSITGFQKIDLDNLKLHFHSCFAVSFCERTRVVFEDFQGRIWVGTLNGLYQFQEDSLMVPVTDHPDFSLRIEDITQLSDSTLAVGTKGAGIILWKNDHFKQITTANGLTSNMIGNVFVDEQDNIWIGTLMGLNKVERFNADSIFVKQYTIEHGMPSNEINRVKTLNGHVWVATDKGLVHFKDQITPNNSSTPPLIEKILVNDNALESFDNLQLSHQDNNLIVNYLTLDHSQNGKVFYRYRLSLGRKAWTHTLNRNAHFSALKDGDYIFEVQSQNEDGVWSASTWYKFTVRPPFWQTWWFLLGGLGALGFAVFRFYKYRTNQIRHEAEGVKQMAELERSALRAQMNPHFIFNSLNAIQGFIAQGDKATANRYLSRFAKLIRAALEHSRVTKILLEDDLSNLENYLELEQLRFQNGFDFSITLAEDIDVGDISVPPMLVQPFVENAIVHGLAKIDGKGLIDIDYRQSDGFLLVTITDNGVGVEVSKKLKAGMASSHKSVGMTVTARRLEMLSGNGGVGRMEITEMKDEEGKVAGTRVQVWMPVV